MDDSRIVALIREKSEEALTELSNKYERVCVRIAGNILSDERDVQECLNDAYLQVWNSPPDDPERLLPYLCTTVKNRALRMYNRNKARNGMTNYVESMDELDQLILGSGADEKVYEYELKAALNEFLAHLSKRDRTVFVRRIWFCDSYEDIAKLMGMSNGALRTKLARIRKDLKAFLTKKGFL